MLSELLELAESIVDEGGDGLVCISKAFLQINYWVSLVHAKPGRDYSSQGPQGTNMSKHHNV